MSIVRRYAVHLTWSRFPPEVNQAIKAERYELIPCFLGGKQQGIHVATLVFSLTFILLFSSFDSPSPHPRFDFRDILTNTVFSAQLKSSSYWETPPLNRRCFRVNEG